MSKLLIKAIKSKNLEKVKRLMGKVNINYNNSYAINWAIERNLANIVKLLVRNNAKISEKQLTKAINHNSVQCIKILMNYVRANESHLSAAIKAHNHKLIKLLLRTLRPNKDDYIWAIINNKIKIIDILKPYFKPPSVNAEQFFELCFRLLNKDDPDHAQLILENINLTSYQKNELKKEAKRTKRKNILKILNG